MQLGPEVNGEARDHPERAGRQALLEPRPEKRDAAALAQGGEDRIVDVAERIGVAEAQHVVGPGDARVVVQIVEHAAAIRRRADLGNQRPAAPGSPASATTSPLSART